MSAHFQSLLKNSPSEMKSHEFYSFESPFIALATRTPLVRSRDALQRSTAASCMRRTHRADRFQTDVYLFRLLFQKLQNKEGEIADEIQGRVGPFLLRWLVSHRHPRNMTSRYWRYFSTEGQFSSELPEFSIPSSCVEAIKTHLAPPSEF